MHLDINMHMYMYILELLGGYRQYGKVRDARGGRARDCVRLRMRIGTAGLSFSLLFVLVWIVTTGFSSPSRRSRSGLLAGGIFWCSGIISMASVTADPATELPLLQHCNCYCVLSVIWFIGNGIRASGVWAMIFGISSLLDKPTAPYLRTRQGTHHRWQ